MKLLIGIFFRNKIKKEYIDTLIAALALITIVIGVSSAIKTTDFLCLIICLVVGTLAGMLLKLSDRLDGAGDFIKSKLPKMKNDRFTEGFVSACILFCKRVIVSYNEDEYARILAAVDGGALAAQVRELSLKAADAALTERRRSE